MALSRKGTLPFQAALGSVVTFLPFSSAWQTGTPSCSPPCPPACEQESVWSLNTRLPIPRCFGTKPVFLNRVVSPSESLTFGGAGALAPPSLPVAHRPSFLKQEGELARGRIHALRRKVKRARSPTRPHRLSGSNPFGSTDSIFLRLPFSCPSVFSSTMERQARRSILPEKDVSSRKRSALGALFVLLSSATHQGAPQLIPHLSERQGSSALRSRPADMTGFPSGHLDLSSIRPRTRCASSLINCLLVSNTLSVQAAFESIPAYPHPGR